MHGISQIKLFTDLTDEDIDNMIDVNLKSVFSVTQEVVKSMIKNQEGDIINISSVWGITGGSCEVHYSATKAGIIGMSKALAKELATSNIRVNVIAPGVIDTDMNNELTKEEMKVLENEIPLKRIGKAEEIANTAYMLTENKYITGQVITVDGGWMN
jgi:3-oxoacyl-[acyl-carrier protein] reductase